jgi:hypothetical protein
VSREWLLQLVKADPQLLSLATLPDKVAHIAQGMQWDPQQLVTQLVVSGCNNLEAFCVIVTALHHGLCVDDQGIQ